LDTKLEAIRAGRYRKSDFIIADAKDPDMGSGILGHGVVRSPDGTSVRGRTRAEFIDEIVRIIDQDIVDIMLVSASNLDLLHRRGAFQGSAVKPAVRLNDTPDGWGGIRHARYHQEPSTPFRTASLARTMSGTATPSVGAPVAGTDLGLYSVTFMNERKADLASLEAFSAFRAEVAANNMKYFFEIFNPNVESGMSQEEIGEYINDCIVRALAGVAQADRPQFLKLVYNGPKALEELASFDPSLVVGVLGGGAGTTRDTFELLSQAERFGARVALFGRKIKLAEDSLALIAMMRQVVDGALTPEEAVKAYHGELQKAGITPLRSLADDREITEPVLGAAARKKAA